MFAIFPDAATGFAAANDLVAKYAAQGATVDSLINKWAPANAPGNTPQSTANYVDYVSKAMGVTPNTPVSATKSNTDIINSILDWWPGMKPNAQSPEDAQKAGEAAYAKQTASTLFGLDIGRVAAFLLGLICIAGAIYLFNPEYANNVASSVSEGVSGVAAVAAV